MSPGSDGEGAQPADSATGADGSSELPSAEATERAAVRAEERLRYALADLDNLRKRVDRTVARERAAERERCARLWLPVLDDLDRALDEAEATRSPLAAGVAIIRESALAAMVELGFARMEPLGQRFDPELHEALGTIPSGEPARTVVGVVRPGYGHDPVLRPAGVMVSQGQG